MTCTPPEYFEQLYGASEDPWVLASKWYEQRKHALTVASLPDRRYRSAFEPGCSVGALSERLATRCDRLLSADHIAAVVATARRRLQALPHVRVEQMAIPEDWPPGPLDLLVLSEVGYYFDAGELRWLLERAQRSLETNATLVAVHWTGETDYPLTAAETHELIAATPTLHPVVHHLDEQWVLDVWRYRP